MTANNCIRPPHCGCPAGAAPRPALPVSAPSVKAVAGQPREA